MFNIKFTFKICKHNGLGSKHHILLNEFPLEHEAKPMFAPISIKKSQYPLSKYIYL